MNATQGQNITFNQNSIGTIFVDNQVSGTGFVIGEENIVVTCAHVIDNSKTISFRKLHDSTQFKLVVYKIDASNDIALLKCDTHLSKFPFKVDPSKVVLNQAIYYLGYNSTIKTEGEPTIALSSGNISSIGTTWEQVHEVEFIEFKGAGIPGYSGCPVMSASGGVIGVMTQAYLHQGIKGGRVNQMNRCSLLKNVL